MMQGLGQVFQNYLELVITAIQLKGIAKKTFLMYQWIKKVSPALTGEKEVFSIALSIWYR